MTMTDAMSRKHKRKRKDGTARTDHAKTDEPSASSMDIDSTPSTSLTAKEQHDNPNSGPLASSSSTVATTPNQNQSSTTPSKQKQKAKSTSSTTKTSYTIHPRWTYLRLRATLRNPSSCSSSSATTASNIETATETLLDATTLRLYITAALSRALGDFGAAVPVDILHIVRVSSFSDPPLAESATPDAGKRTKAATAKTPSAAAHDAYVRVPVEDGDAFVAAVGGFVGGGGGGEWMVSVRGRAEWLALLTGDDRGEDVFDFSEPQR